MKLKIKNILIAYIISTFLISCNLIQEDNAANKSTDVSSWTSNAVIYEVNIRQYTDEGTFKAFEKQLPRLKELGVDILWIMPIQPIGEKNRKGTMGSYYSVKDYMKINPEFGTMDDFKSLVNKIHDLNMYVIVDWVANHTSWDNVLIEKHPDWFTKDSLGNIIAPVDDWTDVADLNYNNEQLQKYMIKALKFWVQEADIDGYRCDVAGMVPVEFWDKACSELNKMKPVFMLAEWEDAGLLKNAFHMDYSWSLLHIMNEIAKGEKNALAIDSLMMKKDSVYQSDDINMNFITNHDENSWNGTAAQRYGAGVKTFAALTFTLPGMPLIYSGQESNNQKMIKFFEKDLIEWGTYEFADFYKVLTELKEKNSALDVGENGGTFSRIYSDKNEQVFAFVRTNNNDKVFAIFNLSDKNTEVTFDSDLIQDTYNNIFDNSKMDIKSNQTINLNAWDFLILEK